MKTCVYLGLAVAVAACAPDDPAPRKKIVRKPHPIPETWVIVGEPKRISDTEDMRLVRFPFPPLASDESLETVCVLYRNHEFKTAQMTCPNGAPELTGFDPVVAEPPER